MARTRIETIINETGLASTKSHVLKIELLPKLSLHCVYSLVSTINQNFADTDVNPVLDRITISNHGYQTGLKGQFTTTGSLPGGISALTDYFIIRIDASTIKVADSLVNAEAGTGILINTTGSGTHTFTPTAYSGGTIGLSTSNDKINYVNLPSCQVTIDSAGNSMFNIVEPSYLYLKFTFTPSSGAVNLSVILNGYDSLGGKEGVGHVQ